MIEAPSGNGVESVARWLGTPDRPHFSWLDFPGDRLVVGAVVFCPTMGLEAAYSARAVRDLAHRLAASRWVALRMDYAGIGDSAGSWTDPELVEEWLRGVREAIQYVRDLGVARVAVVGLRLGATLAAAELARGGVVDDLVLWDPSPTGKAFLREQRALWAFLRSQAVEWGILREDQVWGSGDESEAGSFEAPGVMFSAPTVLELERLAIASADRSLAGRELVLTRKGRKVPRALDERRTLPGVEFEEINGQEGLLEISALTPEQTLERIVSWLTESSGPLVRIDPPSEHAPATHRVEGRPSIVERPLTIGPARLFGILSEREDRVDTSAPTVVFVNAGRIDHHGPARVWVDLARACAAEGFRCLRMDLSGLGDSPTRPGRTEGVEFPADALMDMADMRREITTEFGPELMLVGLCSGGYHAIETALLEPVISLCAINPAISLYPWDPRPERRFEPTVEAAYPERNSTHPWVSRLVDRLALLRKTARKAPGGWWVLKRFFVSPSPAQVFERLTQSGVEVLIVAGNSDAHRLREGEQRRYRSLIRKGSFELEVIPDLEHSLLERTGRVHVSEHIRAFLTQSLVDGATANGLGAIRGNTSDPKDVVSSSGSTPHTR
jgi:pimeloyl-ACP methyl ester carboxylesterase